VKGKGPTPGGHPFELDYCGLKKVRRPGKEVFFSKGQPGTSVRTSKTGRRVRLGGHRCAGGKQGILRARAGKGGEDKAGEGRGKGFAKGFFGRQERKEKGGGKIATALEEMGGGLLQALFLLMGDAGAMSAVPPCVLEGERGGQGGN